MIFTEHDVVSYAGGLELSHQIDQAKEQVLVYLQDSLVEANISALADNEAPLTVNHIDWEFKPVGDGDGGQLLLVIGRFNRA